MYENLTVFQTSHALARHAGQRQALVAENIANSDTPNFRPRDLSNFADSFQGTTGLKSTRVGHLHGQSAGVSSAQVETFSGPAQSPNGNAVSVEQEMLRAVDIKRQHDRALTVYRHAMTVIQSSLGRR